MTKLSTFFTLEEMTRSPKAEAEGINNTPTLTELVNLQTTSLRLDEVRKLLGHPMLISSGYRGAALNKAIGGSATSAHLAGAAADFTCPGFGTPVKVFARIRNSGIKFDQLILEKNRWVHIGFGTKNRGQCLIYDGKTYTEVA